MKPVLVVLGLIIIIMGIAWALQGAGYLPTSFMTGTPWVAIGSGVAVGGGFLAAFGLRRSRSLEDKL